MAIYSIKDLRKEFLSARESDDKDAFMVRQQELIEKLVKENEALVEKIKESEKMLVTTNQNLIIGTPNYEEAICVEQLRILKEKSMTRELDINEVKKLDLLIKNLRLLQSQPTSNINAEFRDVSEVDLVAIAKSEQENK